MSDGTIIPSYMSYTERGSLVDMGNQSDTSLRFGEVKAIVYPDDEKSVSKRFIEYTVNVFHKDSSGPGSTQVYGGCVVCNTFGLGGDIVTYTLRPDRAQNNSSSAPQVGVGAKVLLLCINGDRPRAVIVGGLRDPITQSDPEEVIDKKDNGHNLYFEFNGVSFAINKDGEATLQFKGATDAKGKANEGNEASAQPTTVKIAKNGDFSVTTKDDGQFIKIEHKDKKIRVKGDAKVIIECQAIHLGAEDPDDNLALAKLTKGELKAIRDSLAGLVSSYNGHTHSVKGIQTAGSPVAHTQTKPVDTGNPSSTASSPAAVKDVKSTVVLSK